jgi:hypothetical protein
MFISGTPGGVTMLIKVIYKDDGMGLVEDATLDFLIKAHRILAFERSEGLVTIGRDPIRQNDREYFGPDRRRVLH